MATRPSDTFWQDGTSPFLYPGLNTRENAVKDYAEDLASEVGGVRVIETPEAHGAARDGSTDDTAAIIAAINAAVAAAQSTGTYYCEVHFSAGSYLCSSSTTKGGSTLGNAQIPIPAIVPETDQKVILKLKGAGRAAAMHWAQSQTLEIGTVIHSTLTGLSSDGTYGAPSVIGGPTVQVGSNGLAPFFSNIHVVIDGLTVTTPQNPTLVGVDLRGCAQASVLDLACMVRASPSTLSSAGGGSNALGVGLMMPAPGNNAVCDIGFYSCEGFNCGIVMSEHVTAQRMLLVYLVTAIFISTSLHSVSTNHASSILYCCAEAVTTVIATDATGSIAFGLNIVTLDVEVVNSGTHISDTTNMLRGEIHWHDYAGTTPRISGASNVRIIDEVVTRGVFTPSRPATTVASTPIFRDMALTVTAGTVTAIAVDGTATGLTSGTVIVPTGKSFTLTYSSNPTLVGVKI